VLLPGPEPPIPLSQIHPHITSRHPHTRCLFIPLT
jgi:hypothetical protein